MTEIDRKDVTEHVKRIVVRKDNVSLEYKSFESDAKPGFRKYLIVLGPEGHEHNARLELAAENFTILRELMDAI